MRKRLFFQFFQTILIIFLLFSVCISFLFPVSAQDSVITDLPGTSGATTVFLYNFESDQVLLKRSSANAIAPASTVKIMTGLLAIRHLAHRLDESVTITADMLNGLQGYTIQLKENTTVRIEDLLYGVICGGGNDAAQAVAILCCGSISAFVAEMNEAAREIGCTGTRYTNPTGIDETGMYTTLADTVLIAKEAIRQPLFMTMSGSSSHSYTISETEETAVFYNRNAQISSFSGIGYQNKYVKGLNAGMTDRGGYCVVSYATDGHESYLCIVMGAVQTTEGILSYQIANRLIYYVIQNYSYLAIAEQGTAICTIPVELALPKGNAEQAVLSCILAEPLYGYLPADTDVSADLTFRPYLHRETLTAPVTEGTVVGGVYVYWEDILVAHGKLIVTENVSPNGLLKALSAMKQWIGSRVTIISLLAFAILSAAFFGIPHLIKKHKKVRRILYHKRDK